MGDVELMGPIEYHPLHRCARDTATQEWLGILDLVYTVESVQFEIQSVVIVDNGGDKWKLTHRPSGPPKGWVDGVS